MEFHKVHPICYIVDVECPFGPQIIKKEGEEIDLYNPLEYEIARQWKMKMKIIILIIVMSMRRVSKIHQDEYQGNWNRVLSK